MSRSKRITTIRKRAETRVENIKFMSAVRKARERANLRVQQSYLHGMLHESITPGLRELVNRRGQEVWNQLHQP